MEQTDDAGRSQVEQQLAPEAARTEAHTRSVRTAVCRRPQIISSAFERSHINKSDGSVAGFLHGWCLDVSLRRTWLRSPDDPHGLTSSRRQRCFLEQRSVTRQTVRYLPPDQFYAETLECADLGCC